MPPSKTTIVPPNDPTSVIKSASLKIIVLGDHQTIVNRADLRAKHPIGQIDRQVIWYQQVPEHLDKIFDGLPQDYSNVKAFAASTINKVAHIIVNIQDADNVGIMTAFNRAGLIEFNQTDQEL